MVSRYLAGRRRASSRRVIQAPEIIPGDEQDRAGGGSPARPRPPTVLAAASPIERGFPMTLARLVRWSSPACVAAGVLAVATLVLFAVVVGSGTISEAATSPAFYAPTVAALVSTVLLLVGLVGLFVRQAGELGTLGLAGFVIAVVGTALAAGGQWTYVFVLPYLAENAPALADTSSGSVVAGFMLSYLVMAAGWLLFGIATLRTRVFPRWASVLLIVGAAVTVLPMPSRTLLLGIAVACLGVVLARPARGPADPTLASQTA
jgi:hypothetical protein